MRTRTAFLLFAALVNGGLALALWPAPPRPLTPQMKQIQAAARVESANKRGEALRMAVLEGLRNADRKQAEGVISFLEDNSQWIPMTELKPIVSELDPVDPTTERLQLLIDRAELTASDKQERLRIYSEAILDGESRYGVRGMLTRRTGMSAAALDGMSELMPIIEAQYAKLSPGWQKTTTLDWLRWQMHLGAGANDGREALALSLARLQEMGPKAIARESRESAGFREAVVIVARLSCRKGEIVDDVAPTCPGFQELFKAVASEMGSLPGFDRPIAAEEEQEAKIGRWLGEFCDAVGGKRDILALMGVRPPRQ